MPVQLYQHRVQVKCNPFAGVLLEHHSLKQQGSYDVGWWSTQTFGHIEDSVRTVAPHSTQVGRAVRWQLGTSPYSALALPNAVQLCCSEWERQDLQKRKKCWLREGKCSSASKKHCFCIWLSQEGKLGDGKQQGKPFHQIINKTVIGAGEIISSCSPKAANKSMAEKQDLRSPSSFPVPFCIS